ncbi:MAG: triose-phosphate isomerase [Patescibacteria group bacterium]
MAKATSNGARKLIVGNWKMNPTSAEDAKKIFRQIAAKVAPSKKVITVICPPAVYLAPLAQVKKNVVLGTQDIFYEREGAFTGFISASMVKNFGVEYIIVGHSERRKAGLPAGQAGETDELINLKVKAVLKEGLKVILCVGEVEHDENGHYLTVIKKQLEAGLAGVPKNFFANVIIAHEPIWAIGAAAKGADTPENFQHNKLFIRKILSGIAGKKIALAAPVLYGGSVGVKNAESFLTEGDADGLLIGRTSLVPEDFVQIIKIANC